MNQSKAYTIFGRQVSYVVLSNIIILVLGVIQIPIVTKSLGTSLYGTWSLIGVTTTLIIPFSTLSFGMSIVRFLAVEKDKDKVREDFFSALSLVFIVGVVFSLLIFLLSGVIATYILQDSTQAIYIKISSVLVLLNSLFTVLLAFFRRGSYIGIFTLLNFSSNVLNFVLIILFILAGYGLTGILWATVISITVLSIIALALIIKQLGYKPPRFSNMKPYLSWGIPLTPNTLVNWVMQASDRYLLGYFMGVSAVGIYNVAASIGSYSSFVWPPLSIVLYPVVSKTYDEGNREECSNYFRYSFKYLMMITIPATFGLSILARPLLQILTTPEFFSGSSVVWLIALGTLLHAFHQICSFIFHLVGKTQVILRLLIIAAVLNVILNVILIPRLGILGAGIASVSSYAVLGVITPLITQRYFKFDFDILFILKSLTGSAIMATCIWLLKPESLLMVVVSVVLGVIVYFAVLIILRGFTKTEIGFLKQTLKGTQSEKTDS